MVHDKPFYSELVDDADFERLVQSICSRPGMYVMSEADLFTAVHSYLAGYDRGRGGAPLMGFQQWLVTRANGGNNVHWPGTHRRDLQPSSGHTSDEQLVRALGELILDFLVARRRRGLTAIFRDYAEWLTRQEWYDGPLRESKS